MIYLIGIGVIVLLAVTLVALVYRGKAKAEQRQAEMQRQRAEAAEAVNTHRRELDDDLAAIHKTHREETIHVTNPAHLAARVDFDNDWAADTRMHDPGTITHPIPGAPPADSTGAAVDNVGRTDVSE